MKDVGISLSDFEMPSADRTITLFVAELSGANSEKLKSLCLTLGTLPEPSFRLGVTQS